MAEISTQGKTVPAKTIPLSRLDIGDKLYFETAKMLAEHSRLSFLVSAVNAIIVYLILRPLHVDFTMEIWVAVISLVSVGRALLASHFLQLDENSANTKQWLKLYLPAVYLSGACWGVLPLLGSFSSEAWSQAFIIFTVSGMSAGSMVSLYPMLRAALPFLLLVVLPLIYALAGSAQVEQYAMALLASLYLMILVRSAFILNAAARKILRLELQNEELFDFLSITRPDGIDAIAERHDQPKPAVE